MEVNEKAEASATLGQKDVSNGTKNDSAPEPKTSPAKEKPHWLDQYAPWVGTNLRSSKSWKKFIKSWIASWVAFILILPNASGQALGSAGFFCVLSSIFLPPNMPVQFFLFIVSTMTIGLLMGWAFGVAGMRAALAVRDQAALLATELSLRASLASSTDPNAQSEAIFSGIFLDTRSSIMFGAFLTIATFFFGVVRAYAPKLALLSIFGTIAVDVFFTFGPLFPSANYTLLNSFLISLASYMAIACVVNIFVFPETMNHACLDGSIALVGGVKALIDKQTEVLQVDLEELTPGTPLMVGIQKGRSAIIAGINGLRAGSGFINLEFSWGRWNGDDVKSLEQPLLGLVTRVAGFQSFAYLVRAPQFSPHSSSTSVDTDKKKPEAAPTTFDSHLLRQIYQTTSAQESQYSLHIDNIRPVIDEATRDLRTACSEGLESVQHTLSAINQGRWRVNAEKNAECTERFNKALAKLIAASEDFKTVKRKLLVEPYRSLLQIAETPEARFSLPLRSLYLAYMFSANLLTISVGIRTFMEKVRDTQAKRPTMRLWAPKGLRAIGKLFEDKHGDEDAVFGEDRKGLESEAKKEETKYRRDPDSRPPTNIMQKIMERIYLFFRWIQSVEGIFSIKYAILSIALWLPSVLNSSAEFYYVNKGLWALIMAQTTMNLYAGDMIFNFVARIFGTVVGLVIGLACWYIGNGNGPGNPYGLAASAALFLAPLLWLRLYIPPQYTPGILLCGATFALIIGYSWIDNHLGTYGNPGYGWPVAWKRFALVIIGSAASAIIMLFPVRSARKAVRKRNAAIIASISETYAYLIGTWIGSDQVGFGPESPKSLPDWLPDFRLKLVALAEQVVAVRSLTELARWEGNLRGKWPYSSYAKMEEVEQSMVTGLAQLGGALAQLDDEWRLQFLQSTSVLHPNFIGDVMSMFALVSQSLITGEPMHQSLPHTLLDRLFYHRNASPLVDKLQKDMHEIDEISSLNFMYYAAGLVGTYTVLKGLDDLHAITKDLCGEVPLEGFNRWQQDHFEHHNRV